MEIVYFAGAFILLSALIYGPAYPPPEQIPEKGFRPDRARSVRTQHKLTRRIQCPSIQKSRYVITPTNSGRRQVARRESQMIFGGRQRLNWIRKARQTNQQPSRCYNSQPD